ALDLGDNDLISTNTGSATIATQVAYARNGGAWDRAGVTSAAAHDQPDHATGLAVVGGEEWTARTSKTTFDGYAIAASDTLVKYTWNGDANLNGVVDFDDYVATDVGFNTNLTGWTNGDFNYSGSVNFDDYVLIDVAFNVQNGTLARAMAY